MIDDGVVAYFKILPKSINEDFFRRLCKRTFGTDKIQIGKRVNSAGNKDKYFLFELESFGNIADGELTLYGMEGRSSLSLSVSDIYRYFLDFSSKEGKSNWEKFVSYAEKVFSFGKFEWGAIAPHDSFLGVFIESFVYPVNFYGKNYVKKFDIKKIEESGFFEVKKFGDRGLMVRLGEDPLAYNEDSAKKLADLTGQQILGSQKERKNDP